MAIDTLPFEFGRDKKFYVYLYRDPRPSTQNQPIYVGKGSRKRANKHWNYGTENPLLRRMFVKFREASLEPAIEIVAWFDDEAEAFSLEIALIAKFGRRDLNLGPLANMTDGGDGHSNPSADVRAKIAEASSRTQKGRPKTAEHRANIGAAHKGRKQSPLATAKRVAKIIGKTLSVEHRALLSASGQGRPKAPEHRAKLGAALHTPEVNAKRAAGVRTPEARAKASASGLLRWAKARAEKIDTVAQSPP